jgi:hypothetical protein
VSLAALIDALDDADLDRLAELLAPKLAAHQDQVRALDGDRWLRGASEIAGYIGAPRSRVYALVSARRISVSHDGSALIARKSELDDWLKAGGGRRP